MGLENFAKFAEAMGLNTVVWEVPEGETLFVDMNYVAYSCIPAPLRTEGPQDADARIACVRKRLRTVENVKMRLCWDNFRRDPAKEVRAVNTKVCKINTKELIDGLTEFEHYISDGEGEAIAAQGGNYVWSTDTDCLVYGSKFMGAMTGYGNRFMGYSRRDLHAAMRGPSANPYFYVLNGVSCNLGTGTLTHPDYPNLSSFELDQLIISRTLCLLNNDWIKSVITIKNLVNNILYSKHKRSGMETLDNIAQSVPQIVDKFTKTVGYTIIPNKVLEALRKEAAEATEATMEDEFEEMPEVLRNDYLYITKL